MTFILFKTRNMQENERKNERILNEFILCKTRNMQENERNNERILNDFHTL